MGAYSDRERFRISAKLRAYIRSPNVRNRREFNFSLSTLMFALYCRISFPPFYRIWVNTFRALKFSAKFICRMRVGETSRIPLRALLNLSWEASLESRSKWKRRIIAVFFSSSVINFDYMKMENFFFWVN